MNHLFYVKLAYGIAFATLLTFLGASFSRIYFTKSTKHSLKK